MNEFQSLDQSVSDSFDQDYGQPNHIDGNLFKTPVSVNEAYMANDPIDGRTLYLEYQDPLKHVHKMSFKPCIVQIDDSHFVKPHQVNGYYRQDGTYVDSYYRDGDGNTTINRTEAQGGGYWRG